MMCVHILLNIILSSTFFHQVIEKYVSGGMCGYDREGSPVWYDVIGPLDPKGLLRSATKQDFMKTKIRDTEMLRQECRSQSQKVSVIFSSVVLPCLRQLPSSLTRFIRSLERTSKPSLSSTTVKDSGSSTFGSLPLRLTERFVTTDCLTFIHHVHDSTCNSATFLFSDPHYV